MDTKKDRHFQQRNAEKDTNALFIYINQGVFQKIYIVQKNEGRNVLSRSFQNTNLNNLSVYWQMQCPQTEPYGHFKHHVGHYKSELSYMVGCRMHGKQIVK